jgi:hypothetical protein
MYVYYLQKLSLSGKSASNRLVILRFYSRSAITFKLSNFNFDTNLDILNFNLFI